MKDILENPLFYFIGLPVIALTVIEIVSIIVLHHVV